MIGIHVQRDVKSWYVSRYIQRELGGWQTGAVRRLSRSQHVRTLGGFIAQMLGLPARPRKVHFETQTSWPAFDSKTTYATVELNNDQLTIVPLKVVSPFGGLEGISERAATISAKSSADEIGMALNQVLDHCGQPAERGCPRKAHQTQEPKRAAIRSKPSIGNSLDLATTLESLGFFKFTPPEHIESAKREFEKTGLAAIYGENGRTMFHADAESLSQGGVEKFLRRIEPYLETLGVDLNRIIQHFDTDGYRITVNDWVYDIWLIGDKLDPWAMSTIRTFQLVNDLLELASANERVYAVNGGNDLFAFFLTPDMFDAICNYHEYRMRDYPYIPSEAGYPYVPSETANR